MFLENVKGLICCIRDLVMNIFRLTKPTGGNAIPNGGKQPGTDTPPETEPEDAQPGDAGISDSGDTAPSPETPPEDQPGDAETIDTHTPTPPEERSKPEESSKKPSSYKGARGKTDSKNLSHKKESPPNPETKPELICRYSTATNKREILLILPSHKNADVTQDGVALLPNSSDEYLLPNFTHEVTVTWAENNTDTIKLFDEDHPLIFKHRKNWTGDGRRIKRVSSGYSMIFTPNSWTRKISAPAEKARCTDQGFSAHYFFTTGNDEADGFTECDSFFSNKRFLLKGTTIADDSDAGGLFIGDALELIDKEKWKGVSRIRVGEEGHGQWGENFRPEELNKKTLALVLENLDGWFYVRIYDQDVKLIESFDFRRQKNLKQILVDGNPHSSENIVAPRKTGHTETTIKFIGDGISVKNKNIDNANAEKYQVTMMGNDTAMIAAHPDADKTKWIVNGKTEVVICLPRIWWRTEKFDKEIDEWRDTNLEMSRDEFRKNSNTRIVFRLPVTATKINVGFNSFSQYDGARTYQVIFNEDRETKHAEFSMRDFCYHSNIANVSSEEVALRVQCGRAEFSIVCIPADKPKPDSGPKPKPKPKPKPVRPLTKNKGYSRGELEGAGLSLTEVKHKGIIVDRRRRSIHSVNVDTLNNLPHGGSHAD